MELLVTIIILALIFDYINGFHDAANSIATIVSTRVLTPFQAVLWAAFFNFVAFFIAKYIIGGFGIANTVSKTVVEQYITLPIILAGVIAAITWNLITWWKGIPPLLLIPLSEDLQEQLSWQTDLKLFNLISS